LLLCGKYPWVTDLHEKEFFPRGNFPAGNFLLLALSLAVFNYPHYNLMRLNWGYEQASLECLKMVF
jgi:hypothetical protein